MIGDLVAFVAGPLFALFMGANRLVPELCVFFLTYCEELLCRIPQ